MSKFLAIDAHGATDTNAMSDYLEKNIYTSLQPRFTMSPFFGAMARAPIVAPAAVAPDVVLITGAGHGTPTSFQGFQGQAVFSIGAYNPDEVRGKIVHFLSCDSALQLGPDLVAKGCLAYIGYDDNFVFDDAFGESFFKCNGQILLGLADGLSVGDAVGKAKDLFNTTINGLMSQGTADSMAAAQRLQHNLLHLRSPLDGPQWGSADARLAEN